VALYLSEADVGALVGIDDAVTALENAFARWGKDGTENLPRQRLKLPGRGFNLMTAALPAEDVFGHKGYFTGCHLFALYSISGRRLLALIEAGTLGALRTGAASGVATRRLARTDATSVALIGGGKQGRTQLLAVCAVRRIGRVRVFSRTKGNREEFAARMSAELGIPVDPADDAERCVRGADIVIAATKSAEPVVLGDWLAPGTHVNAIGANAYARRELDDAAVLRAGLVVTDDRAQAKIEARELIDLVAGGGLRWEEVVELGDLVRGVHSGRMDTGQITVFKSLGIALEDVAFGNLIYRRALERGLGAEFGPGGK
jgi:ornithine cyclodeaminase/alanine dehydrogenase-like protein (mu-crystallin family)